MLALGPCPIMLTEVSGWKRGLRDGKGSLDVSLVIDRP